MNLHIVVIGVLLILFIIVVSRERADRVKLEKLARDLEKANQDLRQLDKTKSDFISIVSHQLRTPLSIIKGYISMIREGTYGATGEHLRDPLEKVFISTERLVALVSDLLDLSRMERGKMQYTFDRMSVSDIAEPLMKDFEIVAKKKGLSFSWKRGEGAFRVKGDPEKLRQIILNLLDNAIKYTAAGGISITLREEAGRILFEVEDTGSGLTEEETHMIFQKFSRGTEESKSYVGGLGLGLYVAKIIAEAHGGDLIASSIGKGRGSTFTLMLPRSMD